MAKQYEPVDRVKLGIVGVGMGQCFLHPLKDHPNAEVTTICDINQERAKRVAKEFGVKSIYSDYKEMLAKADINAVAVSTPNYLHAPIAIAAFEAGKHVLCEKPQATNAKEGQAMVDAGKKAHKIFMMGFNNRFRSDTQLLKTYIENGDLGDIYYAKTGWVRRSGIPGLGGWFTTKAMSGGGPLIDLGVHVLDLTLWLMGNPRPVSVMGSSYAKFGPKMAKEHGGTYDVEDLAAGFIRLENGATVILEASWAQFVERERIYVELCGTDGGANLEPLKLFTTKNGAQVDITPQFRPVSGHDMETKHFVQCVLTGQEPLATGEHGLHIMKILDAIYESTETGKSVEIAW